METIAVGMIKPGLPAAFAADPDGVNSVESIAVAILIAALIFVVMIITVRMIGGGK